MPFIKGEKWNGNRFGRPPRPEIEILRKGLEKDEKENGSHLIEHAIKLARKDNTVLIAILKKILPDKMQGIDFGNRIIIFKDKEKIAGNNKSRAISS